MPELISLDDSSYDELYERAMEEIRKQAPWWTHREVSDPGIMLIEMWALLADMQSYYLDQIQESHYRKYLKLLGISPDEGECAWAWVFFEFDEETAVRECIIPKGTKLLSDQMVFETEEEVRLIKNRLAGFSYGIYENRIDAMQLVRKNRFALDDDDQKKDLFTFVLDKPLEPRQDFSFFVLLDEGGNRNRVKEDLCMVQLIWEYQISGRWQEAKVVRDDTAGLLFSGIVTLRIAPRGNVQSFSRSVKYTDLEKLSCTQKNPQADSSGHAPCACDDCTGMSGSVREITDIENPPLSDFMLRTMTGNAENGGIRRIRCRIGGGRYDVRPVLYKIYLNAVRVQQKDTLCCEEYAEFTGKCHRVALKSYLAKTGRLQVLREAGHHGKVWEDITGEVRVDEPVTADRMERYVSYAGTGQVKIVCIAEGSDPEEFMMQVTGIAAQKIALPWKKLMRSSVKLMIRQAGEEKKLYRSYNRADPEEVRYRHVWHWNEGENVIVLGDGRHGEIPPASEDGLCLTAVSLWEGEKGNVPVDRITKWQKPELFPHITCTNYMAGRNGRSRREPSEQFEETKGELLRQNRMITEADVRALVLETPGLMIKKATARWKDNTIIVNVFPAYPLKEPYCVEWYRNQVEKYLDSYRLAGTKIKVEVQTELESSTSNIN